MNLKKYNRDKARKANKKLHWCLSCDRSLVGQIGKCPVCGNYADRKKKKQKR